MKYHKCRVFKDRWNGHWFVKCYLSDEYIGEYDLWVIATSMAVRHRQGYIVDVGYLDN